jgi:hypothetical protein
MLLIVIHILGHIQRGTRQREILRMTNTFGGSARLLQSALQGTRALATLFQRSAERLRRRLRTTNTILWCSVLAEISGSSGPSAYCAFLSRRSISPGDKKPAAH